MDTSALIKLVVAEPESPALRTYLGTIPDDTLFTAALTRTELTRAVRRVDAVAITRSRHLLGGLATVNLTNSLLDAAALLEPLLRSLDATHLSRRTACRIGPARRHHLRHQNGRRGRTAGDSGDRTVGDPWDRTIVDNSAPRFR